MKKEKILVSACLLGEACRYDGKSVPCIDIGLLSDKYDIIAVCPEVAGGLPTPRVPSERVGISVINKAGADVTDNYNLGAKSALDLCKKYRIKLAVMKERSPSCGSDKIYDGRFSGKLVPGQGVTTELLRKHGVKVFGESEIKKLL